MYYPTNLFNTPIRVTVEDKVFTCECIEDPDAAEYAEDYEPGYILWRVERIYHQGLDVTDLVYANDVLHDIIMQRINFVFNAEISAYYPFTKI